MDLVKLESVQKVVEMTRSSAKFLCYIFSSKLVQIHHMHHNFYIKCSIMKKVVTTFGNPHKI